MGEEVSTQITSRVNVFIGEMRRRRVFRVAMYYLIGSWTLVQVAATIFPLFEWPLWTIRAVLYAIVACFPLAVVGAWTYELTPDGLRRTEQRLPTVQSTLVASPRSSIARALLYVLLGIVISSAGFGGYLYTTRYLRQAETTLSETIPTRAIILYSRAQAYEDYGRREDAIAHYRMAIDEFPAFEEARQRLAILTGDSIGS